MPGSAVIIVLTVVSILTTVADAPVVVLSPIRVPPWRRMRTHVGHFPILLFIDHKSEKDGTKCRRRHSTRTEGRGPQRGCDRRPERPPAHNFRRVRRSNGITLQDKAKVSQYRPPCGTWAGTPQYLGNRAVRIPKEGARPDIPGPALSADAKLQHVQLCDIQGHT